MAKLTEKEVVEQITNVDIGFLNDNDLYVLNKDFIEHYRENEKKARDQYWHYRYRAFKELADKIEVTINSIQTDQIIGWSGPDWDEQPVYADDQEIYIGGLFLGRIKYADNNFVELLKILKITEEAKERLLEEHAKMIKEYNELANDPELVEYNEIIDQIAKLKEVNGFFAKRAANRKIKKLEERLKEIKPKVDRFNKLSKHYKQKDVVEKFFQELPNHIKDCEKLVKSYLEAKEEYESYDGHYYREGKNAKRHNDATNMVEETEKNAKNFKLIKFYREHEAEFQDTRKTLLMIYAENTDEDFKNNFKTMLAAYDQAVKIAKEEGKDFNTLKEVEQFEYFEAAQKVIEANKQFGTYKDGDGKQ